MDLTHVSFEALTMGLTPVSFEALPMGLTHVSFEALTMGLFSWDDAGYENCITNYTVLIACSYSLHI